jgi:hypothetical protein
MPSEGHAGAEDQVRTSILDTADAGVGQDRLFRGWEDGGRTMAGVQGLGVGVRARGSGLRGEGFRFRI